jgi:hypothetical protein
MTMIIDQAVKNYAAEREWNEWQLKNLASYVERVVTGYIDSMLWSEHCNGTAPADVCDHFGKTGEDAGDCDMSLEYLNYNETDLSGDAYAEIRVDVADFVTANWDDLYGIIDAGQAGHDFLLTRNGHGAGFWDRGNGALGDRLADAARVYGTQGAYVGDDELIYVHG